MPEGDTLRRIARSLEPLVGRVVTASSPHPRGRATGVAAAIDGLRLERVEAIGKNLVLRFEGGVTVRSHLRMVGRWHVGPDEPLRRGRPWLVLRAGGLAATQWNGPLLTLDPRGLERVGPDLLGAVDLEVAVARLRRGAGDRPLGEVLQDQRLVAGIGNMWAAEVLWQVGLAPQLAVPEATDEELEAALAWVRQAMLASVESRRPDLLVYRRAGRPCARCGTAIRSAPLGVAARTAYWCPSCQRGPADDPA